MPQHSTSIVIVGAGPTGLMLANCLQRLGVAFVLFDSKSGPTRESRALVLQARSLEIYAQLGLASTVLQQVIPAPAIVPGFGARTFRALKFQPLSSGLSPYPGLHILEQSKNEQILKESLDAAGADVRWNTRLASIELLGRDGVRVSVLAADGGEQLIEARYLVGADGGSSAVRELCGIPFDGVTNRSTFYVADARGVHGLVEQAVNLRFSETDFLLSFPLGSAGRHRVIGVVHTGGAEPESVSEPEAQQTLHREFGVGYRESSWFSTYRVHHRVARHFRAGAVFLAGDAAHVHSPVGAQGMNTGLQDAHNLACKLADVLVGNAPEISLDRYDAERRPVALRLVASTDRLFSTVTSGSWLARLLRGRVLPHVLPLAAAVAARIARAARIVEYLSQTRIHYWMSDEERRAAHGRRDQVVGRRLPWNGDNYDVLSALSWQIHLYGPCPPDLSPRLARESGLEVQCFPTIRNPRLQAGKAYLIRRDGFVAARQPVQDSTAEWSRWAT
ncbi:FAD-dependent monooxygenase [Psychromicrobium xiongbiense]|uniref:FAD-dependent monooxygenase n=1 Tax=Psychromicrobium xiongbiense TaxID=3051184 RepID=UPI002553D734|nr:FAD-dependent monooxygenase [Psychromicrobium sp. YIM S02556]